jgi:hypothetical protein
VIGCVALKITDSLWILLRDVPPLYRKSRFLVPHISCYYRFIMTLKTDSFRFFFRAALSRNWDRGSGIFLHLNIFSFRFFVLRNENEKAKNPPSSVRFSRLARKKCLPKERTFPTLFLTDPLP